MRGKYGHKRRPFLWLLIVIFVIFSCITLSLFWASKTAAPVPKDFNVSDPTIKNLSSNTLFLGNIYWGRYINDWSMASDLKYSYPFSRLNEFSRDNYNAWISTLECPSVYGISMTSAEEDETLTFNCSPDYLSEAAKWFNAVSLANNHTDNQGLDGFEETKTNLDKNGIQYFGSYDPDNIDDACEIISLPATAEYSDGAMIAVKIPIALCGYQGVFQIPPDEAIAEITRYSEYLPTIAMPHMGAEYVQGPDEIKTNTYHAMIDAGADMVIGDHPHTIQTSEVYNGKPIIYSMGNFIFDQQFSLEVTRSAIINVLFEITNQDPLILEKWIAIGKDCATFKDDCLDEIKSENLTKLSVNYKIGVLGSRDNNKISRPATAEELGSILERLNWSTTANDLQAPYSEL